MTRGGQRKKLIVNIQIWGWGLKLSDCKKMGDLIGELNYRGAKFEN